MINFEIHPPENTHPFGVSPELMLHWFGLTDGYLWLTFGDHTIYQYSEEARAGFENNVPYNDYYLSRFIEDFTELFININESVPDSFFELTKNLPYYFDVAGRCFNKYVSDEDDVNDIDVEEYQNLISWIVERALTSSHLIGGPSIYFFRNVDTIRIVWESEHRLENGANLWTAGSGIYDMQFDDFVTMVSDFGEQFFNAMERQVELACNRDWGSIYLDKIALVKEQANRKADFQTQLLLLKQTNSVTTNWTDLALLYNKVKEEMD